jgi:pyruvate ferredoxin oxidoreductase beta subunit
LPLKEAIYGEVAHTYVPRKFEPVELYLQRQGRFRHLFEPKRDDEIIAHIQATVERYWNKIDKRSGNGKQPALA